MLSSAAEQVRDFDKSIELERARLARLSDEGERASSTERIARLRRSQEQRAGASKPPLVVDRTLVARK
jgi:transcription elongation factor